MRAPILITLIAAASYEALPLDLSKTMDLSKIVAGDQAPRIAAVQPLPNPMLFTG